MPPTLATASIQGVGLLLSMDQRSAWPAAVRTDKRSGIKAKLSPRSGSALTSAHSVCILCFVNCHLDMFHCICWRPYHVECTGSLLTSEVKRHRARLVLGWGTAWEDLRVLPASPVKQRKGSRAGGERREEGAVRGPLCGCVVVKGCVEKANPPPTTCTLDPNRSSLTNVSSLNALLRLGRQHRGEGMARARGLGCFA